MGLQWEEIMWIEELLNWIPTKSVPDWLNELSGTQFCFGFFLYVSSLVLLMNFYSGRS